MALVHRVSFSWRFRSEKGLVRIAATTTGTPLSCSYWGGKSVLRAPDRAKVREIKGEDNILGVFLSLPIPSGGVIHLH